MKTATINIKQETQNEIASMYDGYVVDIVEEDKNYSVVKPVCHDYPIFKIFNGHLKPTEPEVLSSSELFRKIMVLDEYGCNTSFNRQWIEDVMDLCDKNGQLREWLRPEQVELRNRVNNILIHYPNDYYDLRKAFENIKAPYEVER